jgi:hypothetical protein
MKVDMNKTDIVNLLSNQNSYLYQAQGHQVYSQKTSGKAIDLALFFSKHKNPLVVIIISSEDEFIALSNLFNILNKQNKNYNNQIDFIENLLDVAVETPDVNFWLRVHPRISSNNREGKKSSFLDYLLSKSGEYAKYQNIKFNFPNENISIYDLIPVTKLGLNYSSSLGFELLSHGIPVLHVEPKIWTPYPKRIGKTLDDRSFLKSRIYELLLSGYDSIYIKHCLDFISLQCSLESAIIGKHTHLIQVKRESKSLLVKSVLFCIGTLRKSSKSLIVLLADYLTLIAIYLKSSSTYVMFNGAIPEQNGLNQIYHFLKSDSANLRQYNKINHLKNYLELINFENINLLSYFESVKRYLKEDEQSREYFRFLNYNITYYESKY